MFTIQNSRTFFLLIGTVLYSATLILFLTFYVKSNEISTGSLPIVYNFEKPDSVHKTIGSFTSVSESVGSVPVTGTSYFPKSQYLEVFWSRRNKIDKICLLHNACIRQDGTLLVLPKIQSLKEMLYSCGVSKIESITNQNESKNYPLADYNIFGFSPMRWHIPHFVSDVLALLYASELINPSTPHIGIEQECYYSNGKNCSYVSMKDTNGTSTSRISPNQGILIDDRVANMPISSWVPRFIALLPGRPRMMFPRDMFANEMNSMCFNSAVLYNPRRIIFNGRDWFSGNTSVFRDHGISRDSVVRISTVGRNLSFPVNIIILNRDWARSARKNISGNRNLLNSNELKVHLHRLFRKKIPSTRIHIEEHMFDNKTFSEQVDIMQKADIVIATHGAALANLIFARMDIGVLEIMPFAYYGVFDKVARTLHQTYRKIVAIPDTKGFKSCLETHEKTYGKGNIRKAMQIWDEAVRIWKRNGDVELLNVFKTPGTNYSGIRECARCQKLVIDPSEAAAEVILLSKTIFSHILKIK